MTDSTIHEWNSRFKYMSMGCTCLFSKPLLHSNRIVGLIEGSHQVLLPSPNKYNHPYQLKRQEFGHLHLRYVRYNIPTSHLGKKSVKYSPETYIKHITKCQIYCKSTILDIHLTLEHGPVQDLSSIHYRNWTRPRLVRRWGDSTNPWPRTWGQQQWSAEAWEW